MKVVHRHCSVCTNQNKVVRGECGSDEHDESARKKSAGYCCERCTRKALAADVHAAAARCRLHHEQLARLPPHTPCAWEYEPCDAGLSRSSPHALAPSLPQRLLCAPPLRTGRRLEANSAFAHPHSQDSRLPTCARVTGGRNNNSGPCRRTTITPTGSGWNSLGWARYLSRPRRHSRVSVDITWT